MRDGQVYLWSPEAGREDPVRSSGRPHWRAITAIAYHAETDRLYTADAGGLIAAWDLASDAAPSERLLGDPSQERLPIAGLEIGPGGDVLALQGRGEQLTALRLDAQLRDLASPGLADYRLVGAVFDGPDGDLLTIQQQGDQRRLVVWSAREGWRASPLATGADDRFEGLQVTDSALLDWGGGVVRWRPQASERRKVTRMVSRPRAASLIPGDDTAGVLTRLGTVDRWSAEEASVVQSRLGVDGEVTASCAGAEPEQAVLAVKAPHGGSRIELWDTRRLQRVRTLAESPGPIHGLSIAGDRVLALADQLRRDGVDAWIDQYDEHQANWPRWMVDQIERADRVLAVCTATYRKRFEGRETDGGHGADFEGAILTGRETAARFAAAFVGGIERGWFPLVARTRRFRPGRDDELMRIVPDAQRRAHGLPDPMEPAPDPPPEDEDPTDASAEGPSQSGGAR